MNWRELKDRRLTELGGAVSGGLDSSVVTHWLSSKGFSVFASTVNLGQPDEENLDAVADRMISCGATEATIMDGREALAEAGLRVIQAQARYEGGYWNTTGIARPITVQTILPKLQERDIEVLFHGATGRGNDQVRFQIAANTLAPGLEVYAPWRDPEFVAEFPGRLEMIDYCQIHELPIKPPSVARYSTDANMLGLTHEAGDLENVGKPPSFVEPGMGVWAWDAPDKHEIVSVRWEEGRPTSINEKDLSLIEIIDLANRIAGKHGVGIGAHTVENRFVGVKSRGIYEAPGIELLGRSYEYLLQLILDRRATEFLQLISSTISKQVYEGYWLDVATTSALAALDPITQLATGTINVRLYKGDVYFESADNKPESMPYSLYTDDSSMEAQGSFNHTDAEGFLKILGVSARNVGTNQFPKLGR